MYSFLRPYIFKLDPEVAHNLVELGLRHIAPMPLISDFVANRFYYADECLENNVCGMKFYNPVGLAAGFDKNATMIRGLSALGFGFLELGSVTLNPQDGNAKPRIFRFPKEDSIQNSMGFNNDGASKILSRVKKLYPYKIPLGINLGKNKTATDPLSNYEENLKHFSDVGDYYVFNLSSPNTPNLRDLQNSEFVRELFLMAKQNTTKPFFLKICPDNAIDSMLEIVGNAIECGASGVIATNTSVDYSLIEGAKSFGGISGKAIRNKSREVFYELSKAFFGKTTLISVGGISDGEEAYTRIKMGASLVEIYSSLIFEGPSVCKNINSDIVKLIKRDGFDNIAQAIGADLR